MKLKSSVSWGFFSMLIVFKDKIPCIYKVECNHSLVNHLYPRVWKENMAAVLVVLLLLIVTFASCDKPGSDLKPSGSFIDYQVGWIKRVIKRVKFFMSKLGGPTNLEGSFNAMQFEQIFSLLKMCQKNIFTLLKQEPTELNCCVNFITRWRVHTTGTF